MLLGKTTQSLVVVQGEGKTAADCDFSIKYTAMLKLAVVENSNYGYTNGASEVELLGAPPANGSHDITEIIIHNTDSVTHTYFVKVKDGTDYYVQRKLSLTTKQSANYTPVNGWTIG